MLGHKKHFHHLQSPTHLLQDPHQNLASVFFFDYHQSHLACLQIVYQSVKCSDKQIAFRNVQNIQVCFPFDSFWQCICCS